MIRRLIKYRHYILGILVLLGPLYYFSLPKNLFEAPYATILNDSSGDLLSARIASDGQWRFPETDQIPMKYERALLTFEDKHFHSHPGVDLLAMGRALVQNIRAGSVVSGGSTISMQVIRLSRQSKSRNLWQKMIEIIMATRLELRYTKSEILSLYASHAPFGGNTIGIDAASWRYFGRKAADLSWAEAALLAVLPNQPSLLFPGRNEERLKAKRDRLLKRLHDQGEFDQTTLVLAQAEPMPDKPKSLPMHAPHLLDRLALEADSGKQVRSTIDRNKQLAVNQILQNHALLLNGNGVHNAAAVVIDVKSGMVLAYAGNIFDAQNQEHGQQVDVIRAPRSTGSLLKPLLYASMLDDGLMLPNTLLPDIPVSFGSFAPQNFSKTYDGAVGAKMALARSLNVPAVHMLQQYGHPKFHSKLQQLGMSTLTNSADHYGLSLILGGSEGTLWDISNIYAGMARMLNNYHQRPRDKRYANSDLNFARYEYLSQNEEGSTDEILVGQGLLSAASIWFTFDAMQEVYRPGPDASWKLFSSSQKIAWKTGTSFGHRDAWAVGVTPDYVVGVWAGNADGEGRPNLTGISAAAPIMFDIFDRLPYSGWFSPPTGEMIMASIDKQSGHLASPHSSEVDRVTIPKAGLKTGISPFQQLVHLDETGRFRVNGDCESVANMQTKSWFVLPPSQAVYYKEKNPTYQELPPFRNDCYDLESSAMMEMIYPMPNSEVFLPTDIDGKEGEAVFEVAHRDPKSQLHWHLDDIYIGSTLEVHQLSLRPSAGNHLITVIDDRGNVLKRTFKVSSGNSDE